MRQSLTRRMVVRLRPLSLDRLKRSTSAMRMLFSTDVICSALVSSGAFVVHARWFLDQASNSVPPSSVGIASEARKGQALLDAWHRAAFTIHHASEQDMRDLLQAAIGLRRNKAPGVTDQLQQLFMKLYSARGDFESKTKLLRVIYNDFGVQGKVASRLFIRQPLLYQELQPPE